MSRYIFLFVLITALVLVNAKHQHHHHHHHHHHHKTSSSPLSYLDVAGTPYTVSYDHRAILINGQRTLMQSGSIHYPRSTPDMWPDILARTRANGLNVVQIYVFWNYHEPIRGQYDFITDSHNLPLFIQLVAEAGLFMNLRIGPYVCAEWNYGGLPIWLRDDPNMVFRTDNTPWKQEMETFVNYVVKLVEPYLPRHGGPIILIQIENEYGNIESAYGSGATRYVAWAAALGNSYQLDVPWIMCQQNDAPLSVIATCNGYYCDNWLEDHFKNRPTQPGLWTENWPGWFQNWGEPVPHRPVEDVAFSVARWIARGGALFNYYMVHGGTSFGRSTGGPFIITSYDYDVALNEYGLPNEPKYSHSSALHHILNTYATTIMGQDKPVQQSLGWNTESHTYGTIGTIGSIAFLSNIGTSGAASIVTFQNQTYSLPLWSVTIVDGATLNILYCTATISPQHHALALAHTKRASERHTRKHTHATSITTWAEPTNAWNIPIVAPQPLEQISVTKDTSDYLWYQTTVALTQADIDAGSVTLSLTNAYDYVSIFFNNNLIGTGRSIVFETSFQVNVSAMNPGNYPLSISCQMVGMINYGTFLERYTRGLLGTITWNQHDITKSTWSHVVGLYGESLNIYTEVGSHAVTWTPYTSPQPWTWYKLELAIPTPHASKDPAVWALDMHGMGKGAVWVNGHMLGRYWSILATGNCAPCSYVGVYDNPKCRTGCGDYSQRYYHVPASWLNANGPNLVVVWEEQIKANPNTIAFVQMN